MQRSILCADPPARAEAIAARTKSRGPGTFFPEQRTRDDCGRDGCGTQAVTELARGLSWCKDWKAQAAMQGPMACPPWPKDWSSTSWHSCANGIRIQTPCNRVGESAANTRRKGDFKPSCQTLFDNQTISIDSSRKTHALKLTLTDKPSV